jgi:hypothetical protein
MSAQVSIKAAPMTCTGQGADMPTRVDVEAVMPQSDT